MWSMILCIVILIIVGLIVNILNIRTRIKEYNFAKEYYEKFITLLSEILDKKTLNSKDYTWIVSNSDKMQFILGEAGIISYKEYNMFYKDIPILLNVVNEINSLVNESYVGRNDIKMIQWCENAFLRKIGILDEYITNQPKELLNPLYNLTSGIKWFLEIPVNFLYSIGLVSYKRKNKIVNNIWFRILSGIISLLTIFSTIMSVIIGWDEFVEIIKSILNIK